MGSIWPEQSHNETEMEPCSKCASPSCPVMAQSWSHFGPRWNQDVTSTYRGLLRADGCGHHKPTTGPEMGSEWARCDHRVTMRRALVTDGSALAEDWPASSQKRVETEPALKQRSHAGHVLVKDDPRMVTVLQRVARMKPGTERRELRITAAKQGAERQIHPHGTTAGGGGGSRWVAARPMVSHASSHRLTGSSGTTSRALLHQRSVCG